MYIYREREREILFITGGMFIGMRVLKPYLYCYELARSLTIKLRQVKVRVPIHDADLCIYIYIYIYIYVNIHTYTYIYTYIDLFTYKWNAHNPLDFRCITRGHVAVTTSKVI